MITWTKAENEGSLVLSFPRVSQSSFENAEALCCVRAVESVGFWFLVGLRIVTKTLHVGRRV